MDFSLAHIATDKRARVQNIHWGQIYPLPDKIWAGEAPVSVPLPSRVQEGDSTLISTDAGMFMGTSTTWLPNS